MFHSQIVNLKTAEKALRSIGFHYNLLSLSLLGNGLFRTEMFERIELCRYQSTFVMADVVLD